MECLTLTMKGRISTAALMLLFLQPVCSWQVLLSPSTVQRLFRYHQSRASQQDLIMAMATSSATNSMNDAAEAAATISASATGSTAMSSDVAVDSANQDVFLESLRQLTNKSSDIRGRFVDHSTLYDDTGSSTLADVAEAIRRDAVESLQNRQPALTPLAAYFIGQALASTLLRQRSHDEDVSSRSREQLTIGIGMDPRPHGRRLANALASGIESVATTKGEVRVRAAICRGMATTPACASFCRSNLCDTAVMVTASHLPRDRNGFKFFASDAPSGFSKTQIQSLGALAESLAQAWMQVGNRLPLALCETSAKEAPFQEVDWMPIYAGSLKQAIVSKTSSRSANGDNQPLTGLKLVLNPGNGAGGFFQEVLSELGANVSSSIHLEPNGDFPNGIPNPEDTSMLQQTIAVCESAHADLGIMLDTDADRCGFVVPRTNNGLPSITTYVALNRNRLIALLGVVFAREKPGCAVVTDSVTSEGLSTFLQETLGLKHERYIKGYANVINRARELTESGAMNAELAIETSGHCAMRENGYLDDGTCTAVQVVSLLARERSLAASNEGGAKQGLLDLIAEMEELDEVCELRMSAKDGSLETMRQVFDRCVQEIERLCWKLQESVTDDWSIDVDNLEGIRVRLGNGQFFMLRKSLHDPIISLQIEARSHDEARTRIVEPTLRLFLDAPANGAASIDGLLDLDVLRKY